MTKVSRPSCWLIALACGLPAHARAGDRDIVINEIHYNPFGPSSTGDLEFIELHNLGAETVDLGGWMFGEGLVYECPRGLSIGPREYLVFSPYPDRAKSEYGLTRVVGPYEGRLDNDGEIVSLLDSAGRMVSRVHYGDSGEWPSLPDGFGPSLEFMGEESGNDVHSRWAASLVIGGTPGKRNSTYAPLASLSGAAGSYLVPSTSTFRTFKGTAAPSSPALAWTAADFNHEGWAQLPGPFGYGNIQGLTYTTQLGDMRGSYSTFYVRASFSLSEDDLGAILAGEKKLAVHVTYDDAFVAYLNGVEVGRDNVGTAGTPVAYNTNAGTAKTSEVEIPLAPFKSSLRSGANVLAVQGVNARAFGPFGDDFFIGASLSVETTESPPIPEAEGSLVEGALNEYRPGSPGEGFIEVFNPRIEPLDLGGCFLRLGTGESYQFPRPSVLEPGSFLSVGAESLGFSVPLEEETCVLLEPDGSTLIDSLKVTPSGEENSAGRFPDGDEDVFVMTTPTPGEPNVHVFQSQVVINEIHFHPPYVPPGGSCLEKCSDGHQWIELWNAGSSEADLTGWSLTKGVSFDFAAGTKIPAQSALVVAASVLTFQAAHPGVENVVGNWSGRLSHSSDTINLRDALGNRVDHVKYGDGKATNDEAPDDGTDDRTFRGSPWPSEADGTGRTLELSSPALENKFGLSWRASAAAGGTPGAPNSVLDPEPDPVVDGVTHLPPVPGSSEAVTVTCRISAPAGLQSAAVEWGLDGAGFSSVPLSDDGAAPDAAAGDGVFSAAIPPQADRSIVRFRVRALDASGGSIVVPVAPAVSPYAGFTGPYFLYEVDDTRPPASGSPSYRVVMAQSDLQQLRSRDVNSNVLLPCTFICGDVVRHVAGLRFRGETARREPNRSYRIEFPSESKFDGVEKLNLNGSNGGGLGSSIVNEILACDLYRRAGAPYPQMFPVNLRFAGEVAREWDTRYARKENFDEVFLDRFFGGSDGGNLYRAMNPDGPGRPSGNLSYLGPDPEEYRELYDKKSNREEDDFSDIIALCRAFDRTQTPDAIFADELQELIDPVEWAQFFALQTMLTNIDGGIWNNNGEDYFLYHVPASSRRPDAGKFLLLPWDMEETFTDADDALFEHEVASVVRFLTHPRFARLYYEQLALLRDGVGSRLEMRTTFDFVGRMFLPADVFNVVDPLDSYWTARLGYLDLNVSPELNAGAINSTVTGTTIIAPGEVWKFFRGLTHPPGGGNSWTEPGYDDSTWESGATGIGYADGDDVTQLADMLDNYTTFFARKTFQVEDPAAITSLTLLVDYDDAFVAYVNGNEVARSESAPGAAGDPISFDATSTQTHEAGDAESFRLSTATAQLVSGDNVLAVVVLNERANSSDVSFIPTLTVTTAGQQGNIAGGCGGPIYAAGSEIRLSGTADAAATQAVRVNGELAALSLVTGSDGPFGAVWSIRLPLPVGDSVFRVTTHADEEGIGPAVRAADIQVVRFPGSFTQVGGTLAGNTTWTAASSPYRMVQSVQVPAGVTLEIDPGTVVLCAGGTGITVRGLLVADGEAENPIRFKAYSCDDLWGGISIQDTGTGEGAPVQTLRHCVIEHAEALGNAQGVIAPVNSSVLVDHCTLRSLSANALDGTNANVVVQGSLFEEISEGIHCTNSFVAIEDTVFRHMVGDSDAIDFDGTVRGRCIIARCTIEDSTDDGIDLAAASVDILDNVLSGLADKAISFEGNGPHGGPTVAGNLVHGCGTGMALKDGVTVDGHHNTVTECQEGISLFAKDAGPEGGHGTFHSMIVWNNFADVLLDEKSTVEITYSNIGGEDSWPGDGNIVGSPGFEAPEQARYSLLPGSPCIGAGLGSSDMGAVPSSVTPPPTFVRFDVNEGGEVDIADAISALRFLFMGDAGPACWDRMDANDNGAVDIADPIFALRYLFMGGGSIPPPYPEPGVDPTEDDLPCPR